MTDLRARLDAVLALTKGAVIVAPGYFVGDAASTLRLKDDGRSGRLEWRAARNNARYGLEALHQGNEEMAEIWAGLAEGLAASAQAACRASRKGPQTLMRSAKPRGDKARRANEARLLVATVADMRASGSSLKGALAAAVESVPELQQAFGGSTPAALMQAYMRQKRLG